MAYPVYGGKTKKGVFPDMESPIQIDYEAADVPQNDQGVNPFDKGTISQDPLGVVKGLEGK